MDQSYCLLFIVKEGAYRQRLGIVSILIVYGTTEGQTRKIAERSAERVRERGHRLTVLDSSALMPSLDLNSFDAFIIAASVHQKSHQVAISDFVFAHQNLLNARPSAFISVSLSAVLNREEAAQYVQSFISLTGWRPRMTLLLGGAFRITEYDYFQEQIVRLVMQRSGKAEHDSEFTDWNALIAFVDEFLEIRA